MRIRAAHSLAIRPSLPFLSAPCSLLTDSGRRWDPTDYANVRRSRPGVVSRLLALPQGEGLLDICPPEPRAFERDEEMID